MALTVETKYFIKNGDTSRPFIQTIKKTPSLVVVATSNLATEPPDVEISEALYNTYVDALETTRQANVTNNLATVAALVATITPKLIGLGFTADEIDFILS